MKHAVYVINIEQDRQRTYSVTLRRVIVTIVTVENQQVLHILTVSVALVIQKQSACAVLYCHLWRVWLYHIFPRYLINRTIFEKKILDMKCVF